MHCYCGVTIALHFHFLAFKLTDRYTVTQFKTIQRSKVTKETNRRDTQTSIVKWLR